MGGRGTIWVRSGRIERLWRQRQPTGGDTPCALIVLACVQRGRASHAFVILHELIYINPAQHSKESIHAYNERYDEYGWAMLDIAVHKNWGSHIDASHSRQPLVKGERLVRYEVNAVIQKKSTPQEDLDRVRPLVGSFPHSRRARMALSDGAALVAVTVCGRITRCWSPTHTLLHRGGASIVATGGAMAGP